MRGRAAVVLIELGVVEQAPSGRARGLWRHLRDRGGGAMGSAARRRTAGCGATQGPATRASPTAPRGAHQDVDHRSATPSVFVPRVWRLAAAAI